MSHSSSDYQAEGAPRAQTLPPQPNQHDPLPLDLHEHCEIAHLESILASCAWPRRQQEART
jgi:hypothetical protein